MNWLVLFVDMHNRELVIKRKIAKWTAPMCKKGSKVTAPELSETSGLFVIWINVYRMN
jgi:hypothetical protein